MKLKLLSSNENKLKEFKRIIPEIESIKGIDLDEVKADADTVVLYKAKDAYKIAKENGLGKNEGIIVEDTILEINGEEVVDIKFSKIYKKEDFQDVDAKWLVRLGLAINDKIYLFKGEIIGKIINKERGEGFGFDPYFIPEGSSKTLAELGAEKDNYSARKKALLAFKENNYYLEKDINDIPEWVGEYQK